jgi:hypothetical protein
MFQAAPPTTVSVAVGIVVGLAIAIAISDGLHRLLKRLPMPGRVGLPPASA